jgi:glycosyltransferase involved in cell wall biosynthesis
MKLSVITIAYNNLNGLKKTLALFGEAFATDLIEVVVVDGNSSDGSKAFLESQNISRVWVSEPDKGIYNAMNKGLAMASGDYVWFLNSGDYVESRETVEAVLNALNANPDAVYAQKFQPADCRKN